MREDDAFCYGRGYMSFRSIAGACAVFILVGLSSGKADDLDRQIKALHEIRQAAAEICASIAQEGSSQSAGLSGNVKAKLGGVIGKLADLGFDGQGTYKTESYKGVLQSEVAAAIKHSSDCRLEVFKLLQAKLIVSARSDDQRDAQRERNRGSNVYDQQSDTYPDGLPKVFPGGIPNVISGFGNAYGYPGSRGSGNAYGYPGGR